MIIHSIEKRSYTEILSNLPTLGSNTAELDKLISLYRHIQKVIGTMDDVDNGEYNIPWKQPYMETLIKIREFKENYNEYPDLTYLKANRSKFGMEEMTFNIELTLDKLSNQFSIVTSYLLTSAIDYLREHKSKTKVGLYCKSTYVKEQELMSMLHSNDDKINYKSLATKKLKVKDEDQITPILIDDEGTHMFNKRSYSIFGGDSGAGKTDLTLHIMHDIVNNNKVLGSFNVYKPNTRVLFISLDTEQSGIDLKARCYGILQDDEYNNLDYIFGREARREKRKEGHIDYSLKLSEDMATWRWFKLELEKSKPDIVFIDCLKDIFKGKKGMNDESFGLLIDLMADYAVEYNNHICILHHNRKKGTGESGKDRDQDSLAGSFSISSSAGESYLIQKYRDANGELVKDKREIKEIKTRFKVNGKAALEDGLVTTTTLDPVTKKLNISYDYELIKQRELQIKESKNNKNNKYGESTGYSNYSNSNLTFFPNTDLKGAIELDKFLTRLLTKGESRFSYKDIDDRTKNKVGKGNIYNRLSELEAKGVLEKEGTEYVIISEDSTAEQDTKYQNPLSTSGIDIDLDDIIDD